MKLRLFIWVIVLLALPALAMWEIGDTWADLRHVGTSGNASIVNPPASLLSTLMMCGFIVFINFLCKSITGKQPLKEQQGYLFGAAFGTALLGWILAFLNVFVDSWISQPGNPVLQALLYTPLFATLGPAVQCTKYLILSIPGMQERCESRIVFRPPSSGMRSYILVMLVFVGLLGGTRWPVQLYPLFWIAPLLLLISLQLIWKQPTLFSSLPKGDYSNPICSGLAGVVVGNFALFAYHNVGGIAVINVPMFTQLGWLLFGLMCTQLTDLIMEVQPPEKLDGIMVGK